MTIKYLLVTGGAGFIGSNYIKYALSKHPDLHIINLDKFTYAASMANLEGVAQDRHTLVRGDICNAALLTEIFEKRPISGVINFAAQTHVDNSITSPEQFIKTNIEGAFTLLEAARKNWMSAPGQYKEGWQNARFYQISTDEVYGSLGAKGSFKESSPYSPNSPYSASKAGADMLVRSYNKTYGLNTVISNCTNNFGPGQHEEKLIPAIIKNALNGTPIPIYGDGSNVRDWLFVADHCTAIDLIYNKAAPGEVYNIGIGNELKNYDIALKICTLLDTMYPGISGKSYKEQITFTQDRPGHDRRYALDCAKIKKDLNWRPATDFDQALQETLQHYLQKFKHIK